MTRVADTPEAVIGKRMPPVGSSRHDWADCYPVVDAGTRRIVGVVSAERGHEVLAGVGAGVWDDAEQCYWIPAIAGVEPQALSVANAARVLGKSPAALHHYAQRWKWDKVVRDYAVTAARLAELRAGLRDGPGRPPEEE